MADSVKVEEVHDEPKIEEVEDDDEEMPSLEPVTSDGKYKNLEFFSHKK